MLAFEVRRTERLSPHMVRVVLGGPGFQAFVDNGFTDRYVKLVVPKPGVEYPEPFTMEGVQAALPQEQWPAIRTYTVRRYDPIGREIWIDFVDHGESGYAGPWAANAQPGDVIRLRGPGGAYMPAHDADWHLLAGDEAALPAIASALENVPPHVAALAFVEVDGPEDEIELVSPGAVQLRWLHRSAGDPTFADAVRALDFPSGRVHAFVHGELGQVRSLRTFLREERRIPAADLSISGYWRQGKDEEGFQAEKHEEDAQVGTGTASS
jgi:NADPH-dependent ferric siderophore reductase